MKNSKNKFKRFFKILYLRLFRIDDSPQKIALGFGVGIASGILPGTGPIVSLFLAFLFRINRAAALIGCLATNTWLSFLTFVLAIRLGSGILGIDGEKLRQEWEALLKEFHWLSLFELSFLKIALPVLIGYLIIAILLGFLAYVVIIAMIQLKRKKRGVL